MSNADSAPLYNVHNKDGSLLAVGALVEDGFWFAGSASGPITGHISLLYVGKRFEHFRHGLVEVAKINRRTMVLEGVGTEGNFYTGTKYRVPVR